MKIIIKSLILLFIGSNFLFSQDTEGELNFINRSNRLYPGPYTFSVKVYPVSMVFNGDVENGNKYNLVAKNPSNYPYEYEYINGRNKDEIYYIMLLKNEARILNHDYSTTPGARADVGYGIYKVEFYWCDWCTDTCWVEWDAGYPNVNQEIDLWFSLIDDNWLGENPRIVYRWGQGSEQVLPANRKIEAWVQPGITYTRDKVYGTFYYDANVNNYNTIPLDSRRNCNLTQYPNQNQDFDNELSVC